MRKRLLVGLILTLALLSQPVAASCWKCQIYSGGLLSQERAICQQVYIDGFSICSILHLWVTSYCTVEGDRCVWA